MNIDEFERLPGGGVGVKEALARLKRENPEAYAAHVSIMHRRSRGGVAVQEYSPVRGTLAHAAWTATQVMRGQADENDALWHLLPPDCDRLAWWECFEACLRSARYVTVISVSDNEHPCGFAVRKYIFSSKSAKCDPSNPSNCATSLWRSRKWNSTP